MSHTVASSSTIGIKSRTGSKSTKSKANARNMENSAFFASMGYGAPGWDKDDSDSSLDSINLDPPEGMSQEKFDLQQLGIVVEESDLERLKSRLNLDNLFSVVHDTSTMLIKEKRVIAPTSNSMPCGAMTDVTSRIEDQMKLSSFNKDKSSSLDVPFLFRSINGNTNGMKNAKLSAKIESENEKNRLRGSKREDLVSEEDLITQEQRETFFYEQWEDQWDKVGISIHLRPALHHLFSISRAQYSRCPDRFVCRFLNEKYSVSKKLTNNKIIKPSSAKTNHTRMEDSDENNSLFHNLSDNIIQLILQRRYLSLIELPQMIQRVLPSTAIDINGVLYEIVEALALWLGEDRAFGGTQHIKRRKVVDFWKFLSVIQSTPEKTNSTFIHGLRYTKSDFKDRDIEFWKKKNNNFQLGNQNEHFQAELKKKTNEKSQYVKQGKDEPLTLNLGPTQGRQPNPRIAWEFSAAPRTCLSASTARSKQKDSMASILRQN